MPIRTGMTAVPLLAVAMLGWLTTSGRVATVRADGDGGSRSQAATGQQSEKPLSPAEQLQALSKQFGEAANAFYTKTQTDAEGAKELAAMEAILPKSLELAEKNPADPIALDALLQVVNQEMWFEGNTTHPGFGKNTPAMRAIAILLRDHVQSESLSEACRRMQYGFRRECETFLRAVLEKNPSRDIRGLACLRLAQYLNGRLERLDVLRDKPEMAARYAGMFEKDYIESLKRRDRGEAVKEIEGLFEQAAAKYGDVKVPYGSTVGETARSELHEIRDLSVGREAQEIEGQDQDGKKFRLGDYRGQVVLLYFWSEF